MFDVHFIYGPAAIGATDPVRKKIPMKVHFVSTMYEDELRSDRFYVFPTGDIWQKKGRSPVIAPVPWLEGRIHIDEITVFYVMELLMKQQVHMLVPLRILYSGFPFPLTHPMFYVERDLNSDAVYIPPPEPPKEPKTEEVDLTPLARNQDDQNHDDKNNIKTSAAVAVEVKKQAPSVSAMEAGSGRKVRKVIKLDRPEASEHFQQIASNLVVISSDESSTVKGEVVYEGAEVPQGYHILKPFDAQVDAELDARKFWKNPDTGNYHIPAIFPVGDYLVASLVYREKMLSGWWITNMGPKPRWEKYSDPADLPPGVIVEYGID